MPIDVSSLSSLGSSADQAIASIKKLQDALNGLVKPLQDVAKEIKGFDSLSGGLDKLNKSVATTGTAFDNFKSTVTDSLKPLADFNTSIISIADYIATPITSMYKFAESTSKVIKTVEGFKSLPDTLKILSGALENTYKGLDAISSGDILKNLTDLKDSFGIVALEALKMVNPATIAATAVTGVAIAIGVYLYDAAKKAQQALEEAAYERIFGGIAIKADELSQVLDVLNPKITPITSAFESQTTTLEGLHNEYDNTSNALDFLYSQFETTGADTAATSEKIHESLMSLSSNLYESVDTSNQSYFTALREMFTYTDGVIDAEEAGVLQRVSQLDADVKSRIETIQNGIAEIHLEASKRSADGVADYTAEELAKLQEFQTQLDSLCEIERQKQAMRASMDLARTVEDIKNGRIIVENGNYEELTQMVQDKEQAMVDAADLIQQETIINARTNLALAREEYKDDAELLAQIEEDCYLQIAKAAEIHEDAVAKAHANAATAMNALMGPLEDEAQKYDDANQLVVEYNRLSELKSEAIRDGAGALGIQSEYVEDLEKKMSELTQQMDENELITKNWLGTWITIGGETKDELDTILTHMGNALQETEDKVASHGDEMQRLYHNALIDTQNEIETSMLLFSGQMVEMGEGTISSLASGIDNGAEGVGKSTENVARGMVDRYSDILDQHSPSRVFMEKGAGIPDSLSMGIESTRQNVIDTVDNLGAQILENVESTLGGENGSLAMFTFGQGMGQGLIFGILSTLEDILQTIHDVCDNIKQTVEEAFGVSDASSQWWTDTAKTMTLSFQESIYDNMEEDVITPITDFNDTIQEKINEAFEIEQDSSGWFGRMAKVLLESFAKGVDDHVPAVLESFRGMFNQIGRDLEDWLNSIVSAWYEALKEIAKLAKKVGGKISVSKPSRVSIPSFADGGFVPSSAELFMARENGIPEMVGRIGARTAVANNDQIVLAFKQAFKEAMAESSGGQGINVHVSGEFRQRGSDLVAVIDETKDRQGHNITSTLAWSGSA